MPPERQSLQRQGFLGHVSGGLPAVAGLDGPANGACHGQRRGPRPERPLVGHSHEAYHLGMIRAYEEIVDFLAAGTTPRTVARFEPSQETKDRVAELIHREKTTGLAPDEASELDQYLRMEHMMRLAKARARSYFADE